MRTFRVNLMFLLAPLWLVWERVSFLHLRNHTRIEFELWLRLASSGALEWVRPMERLITRLAPRECDR